MREILFRGKDNSGVINHSWCFGSLDTTAKDQPTIIYPDRFGNKCQIIVKKHTVGQYTGLVDLKGNKIFEGDILKDVSDVGDEKLYEVYYNQDLCAFMLDDQYWITPTRDWLSKEDKNPTTMMLQIVGNIHDNPELLRTPKNDEVRE